MKKVSIPGPARGIIRKGDASKSWEARNSTTELDLAVSPIAKSGH